MVAIVGRFLRCLRGSNRSRRPEVIVDFIFEKGLLFLSIENIGDASAFTVSVDFEPGIRSPEGGRDISELPLFRNIEFLPPHKSIVTYVATSASYFHRGEPTKIATHIAYRDHTGKEYKTSIHHDLEIYREIRYIEDPPS